MLELRMWFARLWIALREFNLFRSTRPPDKNDEHQLKNELYSTRLYACLLFLSLLILLIYTAQVKITETITIDSPTLVLYSSLYEDYAETLTCPCINIAIPEEEFMSLRPTFHQVCESDFVTSNWLAFINAASDAYVSSDFRYTGALIFQILASFCYLANDTIESSLPIFYSTRFVTANVIDADLFYTQCQSLIDVYISTTANSFAYSFDFIRDAAFVNGLVSGLFTNFNFDLTAYIPAYYGYRIVSRYKTYNQSNTCSCEMTPSCIASATIQDKNSGEIAFIIPGLYTGCFLVEAVRQSNLQCLYNQTCLNEIQYYLQSPISFNATALRSSEASRYNTSTNISELLGNLMVESWSQNISYSSYYNQCQPKQCTYTQIGKNSILIIFTTLIGLIGGLHKVLFFLVPLIIKIIRRRQDSTNLVVNEVPRTDRTNNQLCCHKMQLLITKIRNAIQSLNVFTSSPPSIDEHQLKTERISTRLYIILLIMCFLVLLSYKATENITQTVTIQAPSFGEYEVLYKEQNEKLSCPCSTIANEYKNFLYIKPLFHQLCMSNFVSDEWINTDIWFPPLINLWDFRRQRRSVFSAMASFCSLANGTTSNALISFNSTQMISVEVLSENVFHKNTAQIVADFILSTTNTFYQNLEFNRASSQTNQIMSGLNTNSIGYFDGSYPTFDIDIYFIDYSSTCSCAVLSQCTVYALIFFINNSLAYPAFMVPGIRQGCYLDEAVRQSTLECFYNQSCVDILMYYLNFTVPLNISALNPDISSIYNITSPIDSLVTNLMIEQWVWNDSFKIYYNHCRPYACFYTFNTKTSFIVILTTLIGLFGGLVKILQLIVPRIVQFARRTRQPNVPHLNVRIRLEAMCQNGIHTIHNFNLFRSITPSDNQEKQLKDEVTSTRLYICLLFISFFILVIYTSQVQVTQTITIKSPTLTLYSSLYKDYSQTLICPCTNIAIAQDKFISLNPIFHPICTSDFIDIRWPLGILNTWGDNFIFNRDFRFRGPTMFNALTSACNLANISINNALINFESSEFISEDVLPERVFTPQIIASIDLFITSILSSFTHSFRIIRDTTKGNALVSNTLSSLTFDLLVNSSISSDNTVGLIGVHYKKYNNKTCSCQNSVTCQEQCSVYTVGSNYVLIYSIPGFVIGCYIFEALLESNLICFFNQSCIDELRQALGFFDNFTTSALDLSQLTEHTVNSTVEDIMETIMVEQWIRNISYEKYFTQCHPIYCTYTYTKKYDVIFVITTIIALIGGLTTIFQIIVPRFVKLVRWFINKREQRRIRTSIIS